MKQAVNDDCRLTYVCMDIQVQWLLSFTSFKGKMGVGQLDIPKGHNSKWFLFQRVIIPKFFNLKKVIIPKTFIPKCRYSEFWNNDPSGLKSLE